MRGISIDATAYDGGPGIELVDDLTPEEVYERQWALTVLERALERVRQAARQSGRSAQFEALKPHLTGEGGTPYVELARQLETNESSVRGMVLRLRKRLGSALRAEIADTVSDPSEVDDEIRRLLSMIRLS